MDITCAHCGEPWDVYGLRHESVEYVTGEQAEQLGVLVAFERYFSGDTAAGRRVNRAVYSATLSGRGCPGTGCGFAPGRGEGPHRERQMRQLVLDGVTDEDPMLFL